MTISTARLTKRYGQKVAVDALDLTVRSGEIFGLLGPNGAGKTTTILMLLGLTEPTAGTVTVEGIDPTRDPLAVKSVVGYLPDEVGFDEELTGRQNLRYTARLNRLPRDESEERISRLLADVGLEEVADRKVGTYSRGMRQRLGLADALVKDPAILILDEPTVNIDPEGVREILDLVRRLRDERGVTVLLSSHLLHQVEQVCDRIGIFLDGRLVAVGTIHELAEADERGAYELECTGPSADVAAALAGLRGCTGVDRDGTRFVMRATRDVRADAVATVADHGWTLLHLSHRGVDLDAIYHRYFGGADHGHDDR